MTRSPWQRRLLSALLAASVVAAGLPGESWAQARPDLELTYGGLLPDKLRLVKFTVKNVGTAPSSATNKVGVITSEPEPTPSFQGLDLPPLKPGESKDVFYTLAADCNGHVVQALVNDPLDLNTANNAVEDKQGLLGRTGRHVA